MGTTANLRFSNLDRLTILFAYRRGLSQKGQPLSPYQSQTLIVAARWRSDDSRTTTQGTQGG